MTGAKEIHMRISSPPSLIGGYGYCSACFDGDYPTPAISLLPHRVEKDSAKGAFFNRQ